MSTRELIEHALYDKWLQEQEQEALMDAELLRRHSARAR